MINQERTTEDSGCALGKSERLAVTRERQRTGTPIHTGRISKWIHDFLAASQSAANSTIKMVRAGIAITLIACIIPLSTADIYAQQAPPADPQYVQLSYEQLNQ